MQLENQVVSLEIAKKLKELGVKQESYFFWVIVNGSWVISGGYELLDEELRMETYSAFTVAELGEMLPEKCFVTDKQDGKWWNVKYLDPHDVSKNYTTAHEGEADARGKMLIYLLENNLIDKKAYEKICTII